MGISRPHRHRFDAPPGDPLMARRSKEAVIRPILISHLADELAGEELIAAVAMLIQEEAIARALVLIHGPERGAQRYAEVGGHVRFTELGEPVLMWAGKR